MVTRVIGVVFAHAALLLAHAAAQLPDESYYEEPPPPPDGEDASDEDSPAFNMLGFNMGLGALPLDGGDKLVGSLGLGIEHPVFRRTRVAFEYDWLWISERGTSERERTGTAPRPDQHASGHRVALSLRRELRAKGRRTVRMFLDGELGGTVALVTDNMDGMQVVPGGYVGLRAGYDIYSKVEDSPSRTFEAALFIRAHGVPAGVGVTMGLGMFWGN